MIRDPSDGTIKPALRTFSDLRAKYGPNWGLRDNSTPKKEAQKAPSAEELAEHYRKYDLGFKPRQTE